MCDSMPPFSQAHISDGSWVKVELHGERFWCSVTRVRPDGVISAVADNDLECSAVRCGDKLELRVHQVLEVADTSDMLDFINLSMVVGATEAALLWRAGRLASGVALPTPPRMRLLLPIATARSNAPRASSTSTTSSSPCTGTPRGVPWTASTAEAKAASAQRM